MRTCFFHHVSCSRYTPTQLMRAMKSTVRYWIMSLVAIVAMTSSLAQAEYLGLLSGRSANPGALTDLSVELGLVTGDLGPADYQNIAARVNYRIAPEIVIFGDVGTSEFGDSDGTPFGLGVLYHLSKQRISPAIDIAAKASYHRGEYEIGSLEGDLSGLSLEVLISGQEPLSAAGLGWYANTGIHRLRSTLIFDDTDTELGVGAGLILPAGPGEAYAGFDFIDEMSLGIGFRYFVR